MRTRMRLSLVAATVVAGGLWPALVATAATSSPPASVLEGTWAAPAATCEQQNAALAEAGFTSEDLELAGWDEATCGGMMHGSQITLEFAGDRLVVYQDGVVGFEAAFQVVDSDTFETGEPGNYDITYEYAIEGDDLTIDVVSDKLVGTPEFILGDRVAGTVIVETAPFTRQSGPRCPTQ